MYAYPRKSKDREAEVRAMSRKPKVYFIMIIIDRFLKADYSKPST